MLNQLGNVVGTVTALDSNTRAFMAALDGQDLPHVQAEDDLSSLASKVKDFLIEIQDDDIRLGKFASEQDRIAQQYTKGSQRLDDLIANSDYDGQLLTTDGAAALGQLNTGNKNLARAGALLADATVEYNNRLEAKAGEFLDAWAKTKKNQNKKETLVFINAVIDVATSLGIGGNAITQLATNKLTNGWKKASDVTNAVALRGGQIGDMFQSFGNGGVTLSNLKARTVSGAVTEIDAGKSRIGNKVSTLLEKLIDYKDELERGKYEGLGGF